MIKSATFLGCNAQVVSSNGDLYYLSNASAILEGNTYSASGTGKSLEEAERNAYEKLRGCISPSKSYPPNFAQRINETHLQSEKEDLNGGGSKQISDKQKSLIATLCKNNHINLENLILKRFTKRIDDLIGSEANMIIRELKGN